MGLAFGSGWVWHAVRVAGLSVALLAMQSCTTAVEPTAPVYATWAGIGPDKWSSAWLIQHDIAPGASIEFRPEGSALAGATAFDVPESPFRRTPEHTTYESLVVANAKTDPRLQHIARIVRDLEIDAWAGHVSAASRPFEQAFRGLQFKYGRQSVPAACYYRLFDAMYGYLGTVSDNNIDIEKLSARLRDLPPCADSATVAKPEQNKFVPEWAPADVLAQIHAGKRVVFLDAREPDEFAEGHIPGAINVPLRETEKAFSPEVSSADLVLPYCVKDFRGFEVAKMLKLRGVTQVGIMNPYGIAGWRHVGLPVTGPNVSDNDAYQKLLACAGSPQECLKNGY